MALREVFLCEWGSKNNDRILHFETKVDGLSGNKVLTVDHYIGNISGRNLPFQIRMEVGIEFLHTIWVKFLH
jgi:hypothetical protein